MKSIQKKVEWEDGEREGMTLFESLDPAVLELRLSVCQSVTKPNHFTFIFPP